MGIKGWLTLGGTVLVGLMALLGVKKKEDEHYEKIQKMIRDVDRNEPKKEETTEKIIDDIEKSFREMGLDKEADAYADAMNVFNEENAYVDNVIKAGMQTLRKANEMLGDSEENRKKQKEIEDNIQNILNSKTGIVDNKELLEAAKRRKEDEQKMLELREKAKDPEWIAEQERIRKEAEEKAEADYKRKVKKAVEQKNWSRLEDLFDGKYAGGPWHPSPASVFSAACSHGDISEDILEMAEAHFGKLWFYSGD